MRHLSTAMGKLSRSSAFFLFLLVSLVIAHDNNNVTTTEMLTKWTTDSNSEISTGSMSESTTESTSELMSGSMIDATSGTTSMAGSQSEITTLTQTTVMTTTQLSGNSSIKNNKKRVALIINPLQKHTKRAGPGRKLKKKAGRLLYQEYDGQTLINEFPMKNLDDVATFFNVYYKTEICQEVCEERD